MTAPLEAVPSSQPYTVSTRDPQSFWGVCRLPKEPLPHWTPSACREAGQAAAQLYREKRASGGQGTCPRSQHQQVREWGRREPWRSSPDQPPLVTDRRLSLQQEMSDLRSCKQWPAGPPGTPDLGPPGQLGSRVKPSSEGSLGLLPAHLGHPHPKRLGRSSLSHSRLGRSRLGGTEGTTCLIEPTTPEEGRESDSIHQPPKGEPRAVLLSFKWPLPGVVPLPRQ